MKRGIFGVLLVIFAREAFAAEIPCALGSYQVVAKKQIAVSCGSVKTPAMTGTVTIKAVVNNSVVDPIVSTGVLSVAENTYLVLVLQTDLVGGTDYEAEIQGTSGTPAVPFDPARLRFSTKPNGALQLPIQVMPTDHGYGRELYIVSTNELENPQSGYLDLQSEDAPGVFVPHRATTSAHCGSVRNYGELYLEFKDHDTPKRLNARMKVEGLKDIFGQDVPIKQQKRFLPATGPKTKDDSFYYAKLLHQAGFNSKPAFILDGKVAPVFPIQSWRNIQLRPSATADIGQGGAIGETKTNDSIQFTLGAGRFIRTERLGIVQGIDPIAGFTYETNHALAHKNALFTSEVQWFVGGTDGSLKQKNFMRFIKEKKADPKLELEDATKAFFGYQFQFYTGVEGGSQISDETAEASKGDSKVTVPKYSIARIYPKVSLALDFTQRFTVTLSGTGRYLFATENVYRERDVPSTTDGDPTKEVCLTTVSGLRPSGKVDISFALDEAGHYALSSTVKLGSLPPNFERVATVQSGLTIKF